MSATLVMMLAAWRKNWATGMAHCMYGMHPIAWNTAHNEKQMAPPMARMV